MVHAVMKPTRLLMHVIAGRWRLEAVFGLAYLLNRTTAMFMLAQIINRAIPGDMAEPDLRFAALLVVIDGRLPDLNKGIVEDLFGSVTTSDHAQNNA